MFERKQNGFTVIELIAVVLIISIIAIVVIPRLINYPDSARNVATQAILGNTRSAIDSFILENNAENGNANFPTYNELSTLGTVLNEPLLANPYNESNTICEADNEWVDGNPPTNIDGLCPNEGWNYDQTNGKFWANTNEDGENLL